MGEEIQRAMGRVEAKIDLLLNRSDHHDKRISAVEKKIYWSSGAAAIIGYITSAILGKHT